MSKVLVHNISDRPHYEGRPAAVRIGSFLIRPGKHALVPDEVVKEKHLDLEGSLLWFGPLPPKYAKTSRSARRLRDAPPAVESKALDIHAARRHLSRLPDAELIELCGKLSPPVGVGAPIREVIIARLGRALFSKGRVLDPEAFFWLGRWRRLGGTYVEVGDDV